MNYTKENLIYYSIIISITCVVPIIAYFNMARYIDNMTILHFIMPTAIGFISSFGLANFYLLKITNKKLQDSEKELKVYAYFDKLTGLRNRVSLYDKMDDMIRQGKRQNILNAVVFMDLDGFKIINDTYGHDAGDYILVTVSQRMLKLLRESDTIARIGGDEFVMLLTNLSDKSKVNSIMDKLISILEEPILFKEIELNISLSAGITFYTNDKSLDSDELIRRADSAMYQAKDIGNGKYEFYTLK